MLPRTAGLGQKQTFDDGKIPIQAVPRLSPDENNSYFEVMMPKLDAALITLLTSLAVALATAIFAYYRYVREQEHQRKTLLNTLFAELANIFEHYTYSAFELPNDTTNSFELLKCLRWSKYGSVSSISDVSKLGFLNASSVRALMQLQLRIRNDDIYLQQLIETTPEAVTKKHLLFAKERLWSRAQEAKYLLHELAEKIPRLKNLLEEIERQLPVSRYDEIHRK